MPLPHIRNSVAGNNRQDPVYSNIFEVYFTLPSALQNEFGNDIAVLTEQVKSIEGLESLDRGPSTSTQTFMGSTRTFLNSRLDSTSHELTVTVQLNLREGTDNYIYKLLKAWNSLGYNLSTGETTLKKDYVADWLKVSIGNRAGDIIREIIFKDVMISEGITGFGSLDYTQNNIVELSIKFISDWAEETNA